MDPREFSQKLGYTGQIDDLRKLLIANGMSSSEVNEMDDLHLSQEILKDYAYITTNYNGEDILLIKRDFLDAFNKAAVWLMR